MHIYNFAHQGAEIVNEAGTAANGGSNLNFLPIFAVSFVTLSVIVVAALLLNQDQNKKPLIKDKK